MKKEKGML